MNKQLLMILQICDNLSELTEEFDKPFGWAKLKSKRAFNKAISQYNIEDKINNFVEDRWTVDYLFGLEHTLLAYREKLDSFMEDDFYISTPDPGKEYNPSVFLPMYFKDTSRGNMIMMEIISPNINFTIMDGNTGSTFSVSSADFVHPSQEKICIVCKMRLIEMLKKYYQKCISMKPATFKRIWFDILEKIKKNKTGKHE